MKATKSKKGARLSLQAVSFTALIALQFVLAPVLAATTYSWDISGDHGYYNSNTKSIQATRPADNEAGGTIWTTILQELAANYTGAPKLEIPVCLLLPSTGYLGYVGADEIRGADIAVTQANMILNGGSSGVNFSDAFRYDTGTSPTQAKMGFDALTGAPDNCQVVIGAAGSAESTGFISDANSRHVPAISPSSTAIELAIPGDYFFRTAANDLVQAPATAAWIYHQGIRYLSIIALNDSYGAGLANGINATFNALGGHVADYAPLIYDYTSASDQQVKTDMLNTQIGMTLESHPASQVGVLILAYGPFDQTIITKAASETNLGKVDWFGTDSIAGDQGLLPPPDGTGSLSIAQFLASVNLTGSQPTSPSLGPGGAVMANLAYNGTSVPKIGGGNIDLSGTGYYPTYSAVPEPYWDYAYDASVLAMLAVLKGNSYNGTSIATWLGRIPGSSIANRTICATGLDALSPTGDRAAQPIIYYSYVAKTLTSTAALPNGFIALTTFLSIATLAIALNRKRRIKDQPPLP